MRSAIAVLLASSVILSGDLGGPGGDLADTGPGGAASSDIDLNGNNLILDADNDSYITEAADDNIGLYLGGALSRQDTTAEQILLGGRDLNVKGGYIYNSTGALDFGAPCTPADDSTGNLCYAGHVEIAANKWLHMGGGAPVSTDCDAAAEGGRLYVDDTNGYVYVCDQVGASTGWAVLFDFSS